jgi:hypothetical protein
MGDWLEYIVEFSVDYLIDNEWEDYTLFGVEGGKVARSLMTISFLCDLINAKSPINVQRLNCNDFVSNVVLTMFNEGDYDPCILFEGTLFEDEGNYCNTGTDGAFYEPKELIMVTTTYGSESSWTIENSSGT